MNDLTLNSNRIQCLELITLSKLIVIILHITDFIGVQSYKMCIDLENKPRLYH